MVSVLLFVREIRDCIISDLLSSTKGPLSSRDQDIEDICYRMSQMRLANDIYMFK